MEKKIIKINLGNLTLLQQRAVINYMSEYTERKLAMEEEHIVNPKDVIKIYKGKLSKPWTWLNWEWEIKDETIKSLCKI